MSKWYGISNEGDMYSMGKCKDLQEANEVADDMGIDPARRHHPHHLRHEGLILDDKLVRDAARPQNFLTVIEVVDEGVERAHPLLDPGGEPAPLGGGEDARDDDEGN